MSSRQEVRVPDLGDFADVEVVEILVEPGARVAAEDSLITLETDKAAMEVPSPAAGVVAEVAVSVGARVSEGDLIVLLDSDAPAAEAASASSETKAAPAAPVQETAAAAATVAGPQAIEVPELGDFDAADISEVHIKVDDVVAVDDPLITLETDKAAMDVPAPVAGKIVSVAVQVGQKIASGGLIAEVLASTAIPASDDTQTIKPNLQNEAPAAPAPAVAAAPATAPEPATSTAVPAALAAH